MLVLGIESSCDECAIAVVRDGKEVLSNVIATQIDFHKPYNGVVPEIASRMHTEWIYGVYEQSLAEAGISDDDIDAIAVTCKPGLLGSLAVGVSFAKTLAYTLDIPFIGVDHILAHLYAPLLEADIEYPFIGLLVSGGHSLICHAKAFDDIEVLGASIDDACGEAFDKVAKHYDLGYPGGVVIDKLAGQGDSKAFTFPDSNLYKGAHTYDVSYSGLKTAVINQLDQFHNEGYEKSIENICASFQKRAVDMIVKRLLLAVNDLDIRTVVAGGGVAANSYLRKRLGDEKNVEVFFPSLKLCTDNGAMIAGLGYHYLQRGDESGLDLKAEARVSRFKRHSGNR